MGSIAANPNTMAKSTIDVIAILTPKAGKADRVEQLLVEAAEKVKANEPGTLKYHLQKETKGDAPTFIMLETYKDSESIKVHGQTDYFKAMGKAFKDEDLLDGPMKVLFTEEAGGYASKL